MNYDLTVGSPRKTLWKFTFPMFISVIFQQFYSITDSAIAGKFAGESALAAIGASYPITMIFMAIATGSNIGCTVVLSQLFGAKKYKDVKTAAYTALYSELSFQALSQLSQSSHRLRCSPQYKHPSQYSQMRRHI